MTSKVVRLSSASAEQAAAAARALGTRAGVLLDAAWRAYAQSPEFRAAILDAGRTLATMDPAAMAAHPSVVPQPDLSATGKPQSPGSSRLADLGVRIALSRQRARLSPTELAAAAGVSLNDVTRLEAGQAVSTSTLLAVTDALGKSEWLDDLESVEPSPLEVVGLVPSPAALVAG